MIKVFDDGKSMCQKHVGHGVLLHITRLNHRTRMWVMSFELMISLVIGWKQTMAYILVAYQLLANVKTQAEHTLLLAGNIRQDLMQDQTIVKWKVRVWGREQIGHYPCSNHDKQYRTGPQAQPWARAKWQQCTSWSWHSWLTEQEAGCDRLLWHNWSSID